jgi:hypothetical protein
MPKGESLRKKNEVKPSGGYDYLKELINIARKNGWDLEGLGLVPKDLPLKEELILTKKQATERNRLVKSILQRFAKILTPPAPNELEAHILTKDRADWLPWEKEVMERLEKWRDEINELRPAILNELRRALLMNSDIKK